MAEWWKSKLRAELKGWESQWRADPILGKFAKWGDVAWATAPAATEEYVPEQGQMDLPQGWDVAGIQASLAEARRQMEAGEITSTQYYQFERSVLGEKEYEKKYRETMQPGYAYNWYKDPQRGVPESLHASLAGISGGPGFLPIGYQQKHELAGLTELRKLFTGGTGTFVRWLIDNKAKALRYEMESQRAGVQDLYRVKQRQLGQDEQSLLDKVQGRVHPDYIDQRTEDYRRFAGDEIGQARIDKWAGGVSGPSAPQYADAPVPSWMRQYLDPATSGHRPTGTEGVGRFRQERQPIAGEGMLRPLGAQEKATPEQMEQMAGYLGWHKAGSPTRYSEQALRDMSDWERHWDEYTRQSQSLFPSRAKLRQRWATARQ